MDFSLLKNYLQSLVESTGGVDTQIRVYQGGEQVFSFCDGWRDEQHKIKASLDDCFYIYSLTKPITCTAAMQLVERGLLDLDAPVSHYLPFFKNATVKKDDAIIPLDKELKVWHLFSMQSGLNYDAGKEKYNKSIAENLPTMEILKAVIEEVPFSFSPGEHWQYACRNHDTLGCIIEAITGKPFPEYLEENIFTPLNMENIDFKVTGFLKDNIADMYRADADGKLETVPFCEWRGPCENYKSGGYGLITNADTYGKFALTMANGGVSPLGARILKTETINKMRTDRLTDSNRSDFWRTPFGYGYALGVRTLVSKDQGSPTPIGEFGWDGAAGGYTMFDTENNIAIIFLTHTLSGNQKLDQNTIRDLTYKGIFG